MQESGPYLFSIPRQSVDGAIYTQGKFPVLPVALILSNTSSLPMIPPKI